MIIYKYLFSVKFLIILLAFLMSGGIGVANAQTPDGVEDITEYPLTYWLASYYEGRDGTPGSASWGNPANGSGGSGSKIFHGEAIFGNGSTSVLISSNGSRTDGRWTQNETPTTPLSPAPNYVGTSWGSNGNPHYQIDMRRTAPDGGTLTFGFGANEVVDDVIDVYVNGVRQYAYFPSGGAPDPRPGNGVGATISVNAGDEILVRFINLGWIGGFTFQFVTPDYPDPVINTLKTVDMAPGSEYALPGNEVIYTIATVESAGGTNTPDSIFLVDTLPNEIVFVNTDFNGAAAGDDVVVFSQTNTLLTYDEAADLRFSNSITKPATFADCTYTPISNLDPAIRHICMNPKGELQPSFTNSQFEFKFRARIK